MTNLKKKIVVVWNNHATNIFRLVSEKVRELFWGIWFVYPGAPLNVIIESAKQVITNLTQADYLTDLVMQMMFLQEGIFAVQKSNQCLKYQNSQMEQI